MAVAPFHQHDQGGRELAALGGENVLAPARALRVGYPLEHMLVAEQLESVGEHVGGDPEALLERLEPRYAEHGITQDQQRPALSDDLQRTSDRANLVRIVALEHVDIVANLLDKS